MFPEPYFVIMEYVSLGKLQAFLRASRASRSYDNLHGKSDKLTSRQLTSFCYQVARGMDFLSSKGVSSFFDQVHLWMEGVLTNVSKHKL